MVDRKLETIFHLSLAGDERCQEHPKFHPEKTTWNHIQTVVIRAKIFAPELLAAAWLHDICKPDAGHKHELGHWTNRFHAEMAADLIDSHTEVQDFIIDRGCDIDLTRFVVRRHMNFKFGWPGRKTKTSQWEQDNLHHLETFEKLDNMVDWQLGSKVAQVEHPSFGKRTGEVQFIGPSPLGIMTFTIDRTPFRVYPENVIVHSCF